MIPIFAVWLWMFKLILIVIGRNNYKRQHRRETVKKELELLVWFKSCLCYMWVNIFIRLYFFSLSCMLHFSEMISTTVCKEPFCLLFTVCFMSLLVARQSLRASRSMNSSLTWAWCLPLMSNRWNQMDELERKSKQIKSQRTTSVTVLVLDWISKSQSSFISQAISRADGRLAFL